MSLLTLQPAGASDPQQPPLRTCVCVRQLDSYLSVADGRTDSSDWSIPACHSGGPHGGRDEALIVMETEPLAVIAAVPWSWMVL